MYSFTKGSKSRTATAVSNTYVESLFIWFKFRQNVILRTQFWAATEIEPVSLASRNATNPFGPKQKGHYEDRPNQT